jgi:2,5-diamino-6-(ribosylamino)-4(3H)-pyrimidinone 5'-phosphate reductase
MKHPHVVCHMMGTVDGRIQTERWSLSAAAEKQYEAVHALHKADAWMCGRQTFQVDFLEQARAAGFSRRAKVPQGDFVAATQALRSKRGAAIKPVYAIAVDSSGKLRWESNDMRGDRLVVLTTEKAPSGYLADLRTKSISYLICGTSEINFASALARLRKYFGIRKLMLEGGGSINGALLAADLIDELSLLICPFADGSPSRPTVFDAADSELGKKARALRLMSAKPRPGGVVWLRYRVS